MSEGKWLSLVCSEGVEDDEAVAEVGRVKGSTLDQFISMIALTSTQLTWQDEAVLHASLEVTSR